MGLAPCPCGARSSWNGQEVSGLRSRTRSPRLGIGYVPEDRRIFSGTCRCGKTSMWPKPAGAGRSCPVWDEARIFALFPDLEPVPRRARAGSSRGGPAADAGDRANTRWAIRGFCRWTSRPRASRPSSSRAGGDDPGSEGHRASRLSLPSRIRLRPCSLRPLLRAREGQRRLFRHCRRVARQPDVPDRYLPATMAGQTAPEGCECSLKLISSTHLICSVAERCSRNDFRKESE